MAAFFSLSAKPDVPHEAAKAGEPYDFVLSDLWMPNVNGFEFIGRLRAAPPRFGAHPCFVLTADTEFGRNPRIEHFTGVLLKPLTYDKLVKVLAA